MEKTLEHLGERLLKKRIITAQQLRTALGMQEERKKQGANEYLGNILKELGYCDDEDIARVLADKHGIPYYNVDKLNITSEIVGMIPRPMADKYKVFPLAVENNTITLAMMNPSDREAINDISYSTNKVIKPVLIRDSDLESLLHKVSNNHVKEVEGFEFFKHSRVRRSVQQRQRINITPGIATAETPTVDLFNKILNLAIEERANDLHIEPLKDNLKIRFRVDGVLIERLNIALDFHEGLVSRIKVLSGLDITDNRQPQDGRTSIEYKGEFVDVRVATLPSYYGERVTLRLLYHDYEQFSMTNLGFSDELLNKVLSISNYPYGLFLVAGPTGSGKSTTLYSALSEINTENKNIITVEDPIERVIEGINQIQYNKKAGITFSSALPAILRNHPDVIMVGEIRDVETGSISTQASLTGHLVLSTIHASDSARGVLHLLDMGIEPYLLESSLTGVLSQRLLRKLCNYCKRKLIVDRKDLLRNYPDFPLNGEKTDKIELYEARGCPRCNQIGYSGRTGVFELLEVSDTIRQAVRDVKSSHEISKLAVAEGMIPLKQNALHKVNTGISSLAEFRRVFI